MKISQDPNLPIRFVIDYLFVEQFFGGVDEPDEPFTSEGMARAYSPAEADSWFHGYAIRRLARSKAFKPVRQWLQKAKAQVVYQPVSGGVTHGDTGRSVILATHRFAVVFLDQGKAALFKMWMAGFNDEEVNRTGIG